MTNQSWGEERRAAILTFFQGFERQHGFNPTVRDVAAGVGLKGTSAAHLHLNKLVEEGKLVRRQVSKGRWSYALP